MDGIKILIVEDDRVTALILQQMLQSKNIAITDIVKRGEDVLASIYRQVPDLIIMDIFLDGEKDGVITYISVLEKFDIPVIFISSYGDHQALLHPVFNKPFLLLLKPVNENELFISIETSLYRQKTEVLLKANQHQFSMLAEFSPDIIILTDLVQKQTVYINKTHLFGYAKEEFLSASSKDLLFEEDIQRMRPYLANILSSVGKQPTSVDVRIKCKGQESLQWVNLRQSIIEKDSRSRKKLLLTVITNITDKKTAEIDLIKTNFELDNFIYRSSHDLNAPLKTIKGLVNLIKMEHDQEKQQNYLDLIVKSVGKMDNYIFDMTNYARNNRLEVINETIDFEDIYRTQVNALRDKEGFNRVQKIFSLSQNADFISDGLRISIIFSNLLSNAVKFQNQNRPGSFIKTNVTITKDYADLVFIDNGIGIKKQFLDKIFDMFYRAAENSNGSGLGLYIVKQISNKLGGTIDVQSEHGVGTTIRIHLPNRLKFITHY